MKDSQLIRKYTAGVIIFFSDTNETIIEIREFVMIDIIMKKIKWLQFKNVTKFQEAYTKA